MKIGIVFVSSDHLLTPFFGKKGLGAIPKSVAHLVEKKGGRITYVGHLDLGQTPAETAIVNKLFQANQFCDCVIVVCCSTLSHEFDEFKDAVFLYSCDLSALRDNYKNAVSSILSRALKRFVFFKQKFDDLKYRKILLLPLQNFQAGEIGEMRAMLSDPANASDFFDGLDKLLEALRARIRPKRSSKYPNRYLIDGRDHYYEYGHEHHGGPDTASPPHGPVCVLNGVLRFGSEYDAERHYNVSIDGRDIEADFINCHGISEPCGPKSHVNLFPNGGV
jgi:hypothetical protein